MNRNAAAASRATTMNSRIDRRTFLRTGAAAAGALALPRFAIGKPGQPANSKLNLAFIGAGNVARQALLPARHENIVALCDVDQSMFADHAQKVPGLEKARRFTDFRVMLDKLGDGIDAVAISTPDHTHFVATLAAMERGKHVFTQKPLTHNVWEARTLRLARANYGVVTQMGNQGHASNGIREMREWYEAGLLGQVGEVHAWHPHPGNWNGALWKRPSEFPPPAQPVPDGFDWDLWLGPVVSERPHNRIYHPGGWRNCYTFGNGILGDWFAHTCDAPVWILDLYEPLSVELEQQEDGLRDWVAARSRVRWDFAARGGKRSCTLFWHDGGYRPEPPPDWSWEGEPPGAGSYWFGDKANAYLDQRSSKPRLARREQMIELKRNDRLPPEKYPRVADGPVHEWFRAIKGEGPEPGSNFDYAARLTEVNLIGVLATRFGGRIDWHPEKGVTNRPELNRYLKPAMRKGWEMGRRLGADVLKAASSLIMLLGLAAAGIAQPAVAAEAAAAAAAKTAADPVMGDWSGRWIDPPEKSYFARFPQLAAQVIDLGGDRYRIRLLERLNVRAEPHLVCEARLVDGELRFAEGGWRGSVTGARFTGALERRDGELAFRLDKVAAPRPGVGTPPPPGAHVLFDGGDLGAWQHRDGREPSWRLVDGALEVVSGNWPHPDGGRNHQHGIGGNLITRESFGSLHAHVEFRCPLEADDRGQARGNSGVFLHPLLEVQVLDSYGLDGHWNEAGAIYKLAPPKVNAAAPPLEWQSYQIELDLPSGSESNARLSVRHNGHTIHRQLPVPSDAASVRLMLQDHGDPLRFRNIWVLPKD